MIHDLAREIDPEAWLAELSNKSGYYRQRRYKSLRAAERCAALLGATRQSPPLMIHSIEEDEG